MAMDAQQEQLLADLGKYGCQSIHVQAEGDLPTYTYSAGVGRTSYAPDIVVFGQPHAVAHRLVHMYYKRLREGALFETDQPIAGFLRNQDCQLRSVHPSWHTILFGWNVWLHDGPSFRMRQLVYPTVEGIWPWDAQANAWLRRNQPLLSQPA